MPSGSDPRGLRRPLRCVSRRGANPRPRQGRRPWIPAALALATLAILAHGCADRHGGATPAGGGGNGGSSGVASGSAGGSSGAGGAAEAGGGGEPGGAAAGDGARPNLLLVTLDTVRADHLGCYGYALAETPTLDALAREGVRFAHASSPVPLTLPAHASILTGLLPPRHGVRNNGGGALPAGTATLATRLAAAGYRTAAFVAAFVLDHRFGLQPGFAVYDDEVNRDPNAGWVLEAARPANQVVDRALAWLGRGDSRPFFLWVHLYDAHAPYNPPSPQRERHPGRPYDGAIAFDDAQLGRLLAEIDRRGWHGRTLVAVAADHGESLGEHGEATHGLLLYEPALAVPMLLRGPGLAPRVVSTPVSLIDLAPTLSGMLRLPPPAASPAVPAAVDGRDLAAALRAGREPPAADLYAETRYPEVFGWSPLSALRRRDVKYIAAPGGRRPELYDLASDPRETVDLAAAASPAAAPARGGHPRSGAADPRLQGFAARLMEIEATAMRLAHAGGAPSGGAAPARPPDAETRARLASLGYVAGPASPREATAADGAPGAVPGAPGTPGASGRRPRRDDPDPRRQVELFQRFERAHVEQLSGNAAAALADLEALVAADPPNPVFRAKLAQDLRERGQLDRAIPLYRRAAADAPADPEAWYNLAACLQEAGRLREARAAIETALRLDPGRAEAHNTLALLLLAERRPEEARRELAIAVAADPRNAHAWNNLGNVLRALGRAGEAERAYRRALAAAPGYAEAWNGLGTLEVGRDRPAAALPYFDRALALSPAYQEVRLNRAIALQMAGDAAAAATAYRDFLRATDPQPRMFAEQRQAARHFLDQLTRAEAAPPSRRPAGGR
jgi:choline-sulfatase